MQTKFFQLAILLLIILIGGYLRLVNLDKNPNGLYVDEAATGYNAYSLLETGKDEYGKTYPLFLRSFGDYKPILYTYFLVPFIYIFDLEVFSVRLLSSLSGTASIVLIFFILREIKLFKSEVTVFIGAFLFSVSAWSIFFSRGAFEANLALMILLASVLMFLMARQRQIYLIPACVLLALTTYAYQAERLIAFVFLIGFGLIFTKLKRKIFDSKILVMALVLFLLIQLPQFSILFTPAFNIRQSGLFYGEQLKNQSSELEPLPNFVAYPLSFVREFLSQGFSYLSPKNLFFEPDSDLQRSLPEMSVFYSWMVIPYLMGLFLLFQRWREKNIQLVFLMLISFILPAALTRDPFSTLRSLPVILPILIIILLGIDQFLKSNLRLTLCVLFVLVVVSLALLYRSLAVLLPNERAREWGFGFSNLASEIKKRPNEKFLIDTNRIKPAYIELAFFLKTPPEILQASVDQTIKDNYYTNTTWDNHYKFGQIETRPINFKEDIYKEQILVGDDLAISEDQAKEHFLSQIFEIKSPTDEVIFRGFKTNPVFKCQYSFIPDKCSKLF